MCNFRANRLVCDAADRAIQVHGGIGYTRALPFEHIYRHHRRYRITEGSEEIQIRNVAAILFGFGKLSPAAATSRAACPRARRSARHRPDRHVRVAAPRPTSRWSRRHAGSVMRAGGSQQAA